MDEVSIAIPAPAPELDTAEAVQYVQRLVNFDFNAEEPKVLSVFEVQSKNLDEQLRDITITSVLMRDSDVHIYYTLEYETAQDMPCSLWTESPGHVIRGSVVNSGWVFPVKGATPVLSERQEN